MGQQRSSFYLSPAAQQHRVAPRPASSGISFRSLPLPNYHELSKVCDHYLAKAQGKYDSRASRLLFDLAHEIKGLLEPLISEEQRLRARVSHLEQLMFQWTEVRVIMLILQAMAKHIRPVMCCLRCPGNFLTSSPFGIGIRRRG